MFRTRTSRAALLALGLAFLALAPIVAHAQKPVLRTLHTLDYYPDGYGAEETLTLAPDGNFYGSCSTGGAVSDGSGSYASEGSLFRISPDGTFHEMYQFGGDLNYNSRGRNGAQPSGPLTVGADGALYGTARSSGPGGGGVVFRITTTRHETSLVKFGPASTTMLFGPIGGLTLAPDGSFYGRTYAGGTHYAGGIFHMTAAGKVSIVHSFRYSQDYAIGDAPVFGPDGALYGTTLAEGTARLGTIYRLTTGGTYTVLHEFTGYDGSFNNARMIVGPDGALYGVTIGGGIGSDGKNSYTGNGVAFRITTSGAYSVLHKFSKDGHGINPYSALTLGADGNFYGTTNNDGTIIQANPYGGGTVFMMTPAGAVTTLYKFHTAFDGFNPHGSVAFGPNGALYGATYSTLYQLTLP